VSSNLKAGVWRTTYVALRMDASVAGAPSCVGSDVPLFLSSDHCTCLASWSSLYYCTFNSMLWCLPEYKNSFLNMPYPENAPVVTRRPPKHETSLLPETALHVDMFQPPHRWQARKALSEIPCDLSCYPPYMQPNPMPRNDNVYYIPMFAIKIFQKLKTEQK
jgi:hypothetical protein